MVNPVTATSPSLSHAAAAVLHHRTIVPFQVIAHPLLLVAVAVVTAIMAIMDAILIIMDVSLST